MRRQLWILALLAVLVVAAGADSQQVWSGPLGPIQTVDLVLGDDRSVSLILSERSKDSNRSTAIGYYTRSKDNLELEIREIRFGGTGAAYRKPADGFTIETPRKGQDGPVPSLQLKAGTKVNFTMSQEGDRLELRTAQGVELNLYKK